MARLSRSAVSQRTAGAYSEVSLNTMPATTNFASDLTTALNRVTKSQHHTTGLEVGSVPMERSSGRSAATAALNRRYELVLMDNTGEHPNSLLANTTPSFSDVRSVPMRRTIPTPLPTTTPTPAPRARIRNNARRGLEGLAPVSVPMARSPGRAPRTASTERIETSNYLAYFEEEVTPTSPHDQLLVSDRPLIASSMITVESPLLTPTLTFSGSADSVSIERVL